MKNTCVMSFCKIAGNTGTQEHLVILGYSRLGGLCAQSQARFGWLLTNNSLLITKL